MFGRGDRESVDRDYREEHLFVLRQALEGYQFVQKQLQACDRELEARLSAIDKQVDANQTPPPARVKRGTSRTPKKMTFDSDGRTLLYECFGTDVTALPGIDLSFGCGLFSELGSELSAWTTGYQFAAWLGYSPAENSSGGKVKSSKTNKVTNRASQIFDWPPSQRAAVRPP